MPREIGRMRCDLVGNNSILHVFFVRQAEVLLRCDIAEHRRTVPSDHCRADRRRNVVISWGNIGYQRTQSVERSFVAKLALLINLLFYFVERNVAGPFDHHLHIMLPCGLSKFAESLQFCKLGFVAGIGNAAGTKAVAE